MKTLLTILASVALSYSALAIPQNFNGGFFGAVGMHFEDFAGQAAAFGKGAEMKGKWAPVERLAAKNGKVASTASGTGEEMKLAIDAVVFGIPATEIKAVKRENAVAEYVVQYSAADDRKRGKQEATLQARVLAGVSAYTGEKAELGKAIERKGVKISVGAGGNGDVVVKFSH